MATSNMRDSSVDHHCAQRNYSPNLERNSTCGPISSHDLKPSQSSLPPECDNSKDASKRKRVNRTAKLKQCKLEAKREQWLSQGNHSRGKHEDQDCHDIMAPKSNNERSPDRYADQGFCIQPSGPDRNERFDTERKLSGTEQNVSSSIKKPLPICQGGVKQVLRWEQSKSSELPEINLVKNQSKDKDLRLNVSLQDDKDLVEVEGKSLLDKCCLSDKESMPSTSMHLAPLNLAPDSGGPSIGKKITLTLPKELTCRMNTFTRAEQETMGLNDPKHDRGPACLGCSGGDFSPTPSTSSCTSSGYAGSSNEENGTHSHDAEDDWEAVADAIYMQGAACKTSDPHKSICSENNIPVEKKQNKCGATPDLKPEYKYKAGMLGGRMRGMGGRAWRPDDAARPPTLPTLSKQHSFPLQSTAPTWSAGHGSSFWGPPPAPSYCPICTEELDMTDSSFVPCPCGFRLCLFCHHRIAAEDGRCPGCRIPYNTDVAMKLSRSSSVRLRAQ